MQDTDAQLELGEVQASICTRDETCQAQVDEHDEDCPIEQQLRDEFGF